MFLERIFKFKDRSAFNALSQAGVIGMHMVSGVAVGAVLGYLLDRWLDTSPWLTGIFCFVGIVAGFKNVYVDTKRLIKAQEEEEKKRYSSQGRNNDNDSGH